MTTNRSAPLIGAVVIALIANLFGVLFFFKPIAEGDTSIVTVHPAFGLLIYVILCVWLFDWSARQMKSPYKSAFVVGASQAILVTDLMFRGERGVLTAVAGAILLLVTWSCVAFVYSRLGGYKRAERTGQKSE